MNECPLLAQGYGNRSALIVSPDAGGVGRANQFMQGLVQFDEVNRGNPTHEETDTARLGTPRHGTHTARHGTARLGTARHGTALNDAPRFTIV